MTLSYGSPSHSTIELELKLSLRLSSCAPIANVRRHSCPSPYVIIRLYASVCKHTTTRTFSSELGVCSGRKSKWVYHIHVLYIYICISYVSYIYHKYTYKLTSILSERLFMLMHPAPAHHPFTCEWGISERLQQRQSPRNISSKKYSTAKALSTTEKNQDTSDTWSHHGLNPPRKIIQIINGASGTNTIEGETRNTQKCTWWLHPWPPPKPNTH